MAASRRQDGQKIEVVVTVTSSNQRRNVREDSGWPDKKTESKVETSLSL